MPIPCENLCFKEMRDCTSHVLLKCPQNLFNKLWANVIKIYKWLQWSSSVSSRIKKTSGWHATDSHPLFVWQFEEAKKQLFKYLLSSLQNEMITMAMIMIM